MNRLASATSPYLLQHADNPVDWYEWGDEAFAEARRRDVPILISVGYSACHWCHVMAHESFEDAQTAALMNQHFVCIKVDREERPDVDAVYMAATQAMTGHGGWPMTVFATHDGRPFYCGTYFPKTGRAGMPSFGDLLVGVNDAWTTRRDEVEQVGTQVAGELARTGAAQPFDGGAALGDEELAAAVDALARDFDPVNAGFGGAPKFPPSMTLIHLFRHYQRTSEGGAADGGSNGSASSVSGIGIGIASPTGANASATRPTRALDLAARTCDAMARGGIYDQLAGGFARYAVDATWTVPHFEKMLYDNALLLRAYTLYWKASTSPLARRVAEETACFLLRDLLTAEGGFASALDADTDGVEGLTYVWSPSSLREVLGETDGPWAAALFGVTERGTFEHGESVLELHADADDPERYERVRAQLSEARSHRPQPHRDDKVVAAWNGLAISALVEASLAFSDPDLLAGATAAAELLVRVHVDNGRLVRTSRDGRASTNPGVLEDYGCVAEAFVVLFSASGERRWLELAEQLLATVRTQFRSEAETSADGPETGDQPAEKSKTAIIWHDTAADSSALYFRPSDPTDNATPSGLSAAAAAFAAYGLAAGSLDHLDDAYLALGAAARLADRAPRFAGYGLAVAEALAAEVPKAFVCPGPFC